MKPRSVLVSVAAASLCLTSSACSGGGGGGGGTPPPPTPPVVTFSHTFPAGDAVAAKGTAWDIVGVRTTVSGHGFTLQLYDTLQVDVTFAQDISNALPAPGQSIALGTPLGAGQLGVQVAINSDGNTSTGGYSGCGNSSLNPFEYVSEGVSRLNDGNYAVYTNGGPIYAEARTAVSGHVLSQTFTLPAIGVDSGNSVPHAGINVASSNGADLNPTDCVPAGSVEIYTDISTIQ